MGLGQACLLEELTAEAGIQGDPSTSLDSRPGLLSAGVTFFRGNHVIWGFRPADEAPRPGRTVSNTFENT
jgi:hypothetical protein